MRRFKNTPPRFGRTLMIVIILLSAGSFFGGCARRDSDTVSEIAVPDTEGAARPDTVKMDRFEQARLGSWWHQRTLANGIDLTPAQISTLDDLLRAAIESRDRFQIAQQEGFKAFASALEAGDEVALAERARHLIQLMADLAKLRADLMIEGVAVLSDSQRETLATENPQVFRRSWLNSGSKPWQRRGGVAQRPAAPQPLRKSQAN